MANNQRNIKNTLARGQRNLACVQLDCERINVMGAASGTPSSFTALEVSDKLIIADDKITDGNHRLVITNKGNISVDYDNGSDSTENIVRLHSKSTTRVDEFLELSAEDAAGYIVRGSNANEGVSGIVGPRDALDLKVGSGNGSVGGDGGDLEVFTGNGSGGVSGGGDAGAMLLTGGTGGSGSSVFGGGVGGGITVQGGTGGSTTAALASGGTGGGISLIGGTGGENTADASRTGNGGDVVVSGGTTEATNALLRRCGNVTVAGGDGGAGIVDQSGGSVLVRGGATDGANGVSGDVVVQGGDHTSGITGSGGDVVLRGGNSATANDGVVSITSPTGASLIEFSDRVILRAATNLANAGELCIGTTVDATANAGGAALPANPVGFLEWNLAGTIIKIPYYAN